MSRLRLASAVVGLSALGLILPATPASAAEPPTFTTTTLHFTTQIGPSTNRVTCDVIGDLRVPSTASTSNPAPALLMTNGFGGSKDDTGPNGNASYAARFAERGFVTLSYSGLGFGGSGCNIYTDDPDYDGQAGSQLVDFLGGKTGVATSGGQPFAIPGLVRSDATAHDGVHHDFDPRVGMIGGSYGGEIQFAVAGIDPRLDALIPIYTWHDLNYSLNPNNTAFTQGVLTSTPGVAKYQWDTLFFGLGVAQPVLHPMFPADPSACVGNRIEICQANAEQDSQGFPGPASQAFYHHVSVSSYLNNIKIPVLLSQGQNDTLFDLQEAIATYRALKAQNTPVKMIWQSWGHSGGTPVPGELDPGTAVPGTGHLDQSVQGQAFIAWFDHWLRDAPVSTGPEFSYFRDYAYTAPPAGSDPAVALAAAQQSYAAAPAYPVGAPAVLQLSGSDALVGADQPVTAGSASFANPGAGGETSYSETSAIGALVPPYDTAGTFAAFTSQPLAGAADVVGVPIATLRLAAPAAAATQSSGPAGQLTLFVKVYDVDPAGNQLLVHNLISPVRIPDVTVPVRVELPGIVHRFPAGHRLRLVVASGDSAYKGNTTAQQVTVVNDPAAPNTLSLPLVAGNLSAAEPVPAVPEVPFAVLLPLVAAGILTVTVRQKFAIAGRRRLARVE